MGKVWVLDTETKGTGANMVPLERVVKKRSSAVEPVFVPRKPNARPPEQLKPAAQHRFKVVDVMTNQELVTDASARDTVEVLSGVRSVVDVTVYIWQEDRGRWRMLTLEECRALWGLAHPQP
jgi:hypothetical protein